jgi:hypothetical protein
MLSEGRATCVHGADEKKNGENNASRKHRGGKWQPYRKLNQTSMTSGRKPL